MVENLIQYSTSGVAAFMQRAAIVALNEGDGSSISRSSGPRKPRSFGETFAPLNRLQVSSPDGAFYLFFKVLGETDTKQLARRLVDEVGVGLAPGTAFGPVASSFCACALPAIRSRSLMPPAALPVG
jgi:aspartate/methionine/tyrosine aminotransferase